MSLLTIQEMSHGFGDKTLFEHVCLEVFKGEHIGVVGRNGAGKSTLMGILTGQIVPDKGEVRWQAGASLGCLDQYAASQGDITLEQYLKTAFTDFYQAEAQMETLYRQSAEDGDQKALNRAATLQQMLIDRDFYALPSKIGRVVTGLGLDAMGLDTLLGALSGGQRAKVILARLLLADPDVLLLDEPTNFLDVQHVAWLAEYLRVFGGTFLVVSHDHDFLEEISTHILDIEFGTIKKYQGVYSQFVRQKAFLREDYLRRYHAQQKKIEMTEAYIRRNIAGVNTKMAQGRRKQLERMDRLEAPAFAEKPNFRFLVAPLLTHRALTVSGLSIGYDSPLLPPLTFAVGGGEKMVITGFNGIGKSTLLKTLMDLIPALGGTYAFSGAATLGYYEQDLVWPDPGRTPMQIIADGYPGLKTREIRGHLARFGVKSEHVTRGIGSLSGGEQSKVKLCRMMMTPYNFLLLDEPSNHLDRETKEVFAQAVVAYQGSMILVSHEEGFYRPIADRVLDIARL